MADDTNVRTIVPGDRLLTVQEVQAQTTLHPATIYRRIGKGTFPAPLRLGEQTVRWRQSDVDRWIADLPVAERSTAA